MNSFTIFWKRYKWYVIGYTIYICSICVILDESGYRYFPWHLFAFLCVAAPLIIYAIVYTIQYKYNKKPFKPNVFLESYFFVDFVKLYGPHIRREQHFNHTTNAPFYTLEISDETGKIVSVRFHSSVGELNGSQLKERKEELFVGKKISDKRWYLYDKNFKEQIKWEEIDIK